MLGKYVGTPIVRYRQQLKTCIHGICFKTGWRKIVLTIWYIVRVPRLNYHWIKISQWHIRVILSTLAICLNDSAWKIDAQISGKINAQLSRLFYCARLSQVRTIFAKNIFKHLFVSSGNFALDYYVWPSIQNNSFYLQKSQSYVMKVLLRV